jgi:hypothetical protein
MWTRGLGVGVGVVVRRGAACFICTNGWGECAVAELLQYTQLRQAAAALLARASEAGFSVSLAIIARAHTHLGPRARSHRSSSLSSSRRVAPSTHSLAGHPTLVVMNTLAGLLLLMLALVAGQQVQAHIPGRNTFSLDHFYDTSRK